MAIYHCSAQVIGRGKGRSAVAAVAYRSGTCLLNEYDGVIHDFTKKRGVIYSEIMLPDYAPERFADRSTLWNDIELSERSNAQLAREYEFSIPLELPREYWIPFAQKTVRELFIDRGMIADFAIHYKETNDNPNPHIHVTLPMRSLDKDGNWEVKSQLVYLCKNAAGEERGFTKEELALPENSGWQKQHRYSKGGDPKAKKIYLSAYEVENDPKYKDYMRIKNDRQPKTAKFGRKNQTLEYWNSKEFLLEIRKGVADHINAELERMGYDQRVDHRSLKDQGVDREPTIHEGVVARGMERKGKVADRCEINRQIKANAEVFNDLNSALDSVQKDLENELLQRDIWNENVRRLKELERQGRNIVKDLETVDLLFERDLIPVIYMDEDQVLHATYFRNVEGAKELIEKTQGSMVYTVPEPQPKRVSEADRLRETYEELKAAKAEMNSLKREINGCKFWEKGKKEQLQSDWAIAMERTRKALEELFKYGVSQYQYIHEMGDSVKIDAKNVEPELMKGEIEHHINRIKQQEAREDWLLERGGAITEEELQQYKEAKSQGRSETEYKEEKKKDKNKGIGD